MEQNHSLTELCPQVHKEFRGISPDHLLNRSGVDRYVYKSFSQIWLEKARSAAKQNEWMEALIYLWVTFNAWTSLVIHDTKYSDKDWYLWRAAGLDPTMSMRFQQMLDTDESFLSSVRQFQELWPVFKVRDLVENDIDSWGAWGDKTTRDEYRIKCFTYGIKKLKFAPECYLDHQSEDVRITGGDPTNVHLDWAHTLSSIYQVRCNLFHGGKSFSNSKDVDFTRLAYIILNEVWKDEW